MTNKTYNLADGALLVDKPADWTSFDVVNFVRRRFQLKKVGHCGTLDPFATGLLILLVGKATRLQDTWMAQDKCYSGTLRLGQETDSQDCTGTLTAEHPLPEGLSMEALQACADSFLGEILQMPPMHSAIKVNGRPLYKLAHQGKSIERTARAIRILRFQIVSAPLPEVAFEVECSKGTYVRTLAADFGARLGCGAHLTALRRLRSGDHAVEQAVPLDTIRQWDFPELQRHLL